MGSSLVLFKLSRVIYHSLLFSLQKTCLLERKNELEMKELERASEQGPESSKAYFRGVVAGTFFHAHGSCASVLSFLFTRFFCIFFAFHNGPNEVAALLERCNFRFCQFK